MSGIHVRGLGAVSPAGWGVTALRDALLRNEPLPTVPLNRPGVDEPFRVRPVPPPDPRPTFLAHPRLRRASAISQQTVGAALEALGEDVPAVQSGKLKLRIIVCLMPGCVTYSRRFFEEVLRDPATASPMLFPETVFNAPASHLAAYLNTNEASYTLAGDDGTFLQGLALAAGWLQDGSADGCLVIGAEEMDWIVVDAVRLFAPKLVQAAGAGALYLRRDAGDKPAVELNCVTDTFSFSATESREYAARAMRRQLPPGGAEELLCLGTQGSRRQDAAELDAWQDWTGQRFEPKRIFGEAFTASAAWLCVAACDALQRGQFAAANVSVVGANQQAVGARFVAAD